MEPHVHPTKFSVIGRSQTIFLNYLIFIIGLVKRYLLSRWSRAYSLLATAVSKLGGDGACHDDPMVPSTLPILVSAASIYWFHYYFVYTFICHQNPAILYCPAIYNVLFLHFVMLLWKNLDCINSLGEKIWDNIKS